MNSRKESLETWIKNFMVPNSCDNSRNGNLSCNFIPTEHNQLMDYTKLETWILLIVIFFFGVLLIRYILSVDKLLKNQDRTNKLLRTIAEKVGIDKAVLDDID